MPEPLIDAIKRHLVKPNPCEKLIKYQGNKIEISLSGETMGTSIDLKNISKQLQEITTATEYAKILDDFQYLICKVEANSVDDPKFAVSLKKFRVLIMWYITNIRMIMKQIQDGLLDGLKDAILKITQNMLDLITKLQNSFLDI